MVITGGTATSGMLRLITPATITPTVAIPVRHITRPTIRAGRWALTIRVPTIQMHGPMAPWSTGPPTTITITAPGAILITTPGITQGPPTIAVPMAMDGMAIGHSMVEAIATGRLLPAMTRWPIARPPPLFRPGREAGVGHLETTVTMLQEAWVSAIATSRSVDPPPW